MAGFGGGGGGWAKLRMAAATTSVFNDVAEARKQTLQEWKEIQRQAAAQRKAIESAKLFKKFRDEASDACKWMETHREVALEDNYSDHTDIQAKIRLHEAFEAEVSGFQQTIQALAEQAKQLINQSHRPREKVQPVQDDLEMQMQELLNLTQQKKKALQKALSSTSNLSTFNSQHGGVMAWCTETQQKLQVDNTPADIATADALLSQHQQTCAEIEAHRATVTAAAALGRDLVQADHFASADIEKSCQELETAYENVCKLAEEKQVFYKQARFLHVFQQQAAEIADWLHAQERALASLSIGTTIAEVLSLQKRHASLLKQIAAQGEKMKSLASQVEQARRDEHYELKSLVTRSTELNERRSAFVAVAEERQRRLAASLDALQLERDMQEALEYMAAKRPFADDEAHKDPANLAGKLKKFEAVDTELTAYAPHVDAIVTRAEVVADDAPEHASRTQGLSADVQQHWSTLRDRMEAKGRRLREAQEMYAFTRDVRDLEAWLRDVEAFVAQPDLGQDVKAVEALLTRQEKCEKDVEGKRPQLQRIVAQAEGFVAEEFLGAQEAQQRSTTLWEGYEDVQGPLTSRRTNLEASLELHRFLVAVQDEEAWIQLKIPIVQSQDYGDSISAARILDVRLKSFEAEVNAREDSIGKLSEWAQRLLDDSHYASSMIQERRNHLTDAWSSFKQDLEQRKQMLAASMKLQTFLADVREARAFLEEVRPVVEETALGQDEDTVQDLIAGHALAVDKLQSFKMTLDKLKQARDDVVHGSAMGEEEADTQHAAVRELYADLEKGADERQQQLQQQLQWFVFKAQCDDLGEWLCVSLVTAAAADVGQSKEDCASLKKQFDDFVADVKKRQPLMQDIRTQASALLQRTSTNGKQVRDMLSRLETKWEQLHTNIDNRARALANAAEIMAFHQEAAETMDWIREKEQELSTDECGHDIASVEALQRQHGALERDLAALGSKLERVFAEAGRLVALHPSFSQPITAKQAEMASRWENMQKTAKRRKQQLADAHAYAKFVADATELLGWITATCNEITHVKPATDVPDAERRLNQHIELRMKIEAHQSAVDAVVETAEQLLDSDHAMRPQVEDIVVEVTNAQETLTVLWDDFHDLHQESVFVQEFHRDVTECEAWFAAHEAFLQASPPTTADGLNNVDLLINRLDQFEKAMGSQGSKVERLATTANAIMQELSSGELQCLYRQQDRTVHRSVFEVSQRRNTLSNATRAWLSKSALVRELAQSVGTSRRSSSASVRMDSSDAENGRAGHTLWSPRRSLDGASIASAAAPGGSAAPMTSSPKPSPLAARRQPPKGSNAVSGKRRLNLDGEASDRAERGSTSDDPGQDGDVHGEKVSSQEDSRAEVKSSGHRQHGVQDTSVDDGADNAPPDDFHLEGDPGVSGSPHKSNGTVPLDEDAEASPAPPLRAPPLIGNSNAEAGLREDSRREEKGYEEKADEGDKVYEGQRLEEQDREDKKEMHETGLGEAPLAPPPAPLPTDITDGTGTSSDSELDIDDWDNDVEQSDVEE